MRAGDIGRSDRYKGTEYMQYRHIELYIDGDAPIFAQLRARIAVEFAEGQEYVANEETVHHLRPVRDSSSCHICPIALLLAHALRHSLVTDHMFIQNVLEHAIRRSDRKVVWLFPNPPVLAAFDQRAARYVHIDKPAAIHQTRQTIRMMALVAGMVDRAYTHALRSGAGRDLAHIDQSAFGRCQRQAGA